MKDLLQRGCAILVFLVVILGSVSLAEESRVWAPQGDVAFFTEDGKIGLQTVSGEILHEATFDKVSYFDEIGQADVFVDNKIGRIDRAGNMVVDPLECDSMWRLGTVPEQVLVFQINGSNFSDHVPRMGFLSLGGEMLSEARWNWISSFRNGFAFAQLEDKYYEIDMRGNIIKDEGWESLASDVYSLYGSYGMTRSEAIILDPHGEKIATFDVIPKENGNGIYTLHGKIHLNGQVYIRDDWQHFKWLSEDRYAFQQSDGKWGVVDQEMNEISPPKWDYLYSDPTPPMYWNYSDNQHTPKGIWLVYNGDKCGWMDETGKMVLEATYDNIAPVGENLWLASTYDDETYRDHYILNEKGQIVFTIPGTIGAVASYGEGSISYTNYETGDWGFVNMEGKILSTIDGEELLYNHSLVSDGRIKLNLGLTLGYADLYGNTIDSRDWKRISDFSHGLAVVEIEDGLRYINNKGKIVGGEEWDFISNYFFTGSQWLAQVGKLNENGEMAYGYIDDQGAKICEVNLTKSQLTGGLRALYLGMDY